MDEFGWEQFFPEPSEEETLLTWGIVAGDLESVLAVMGRGGVDVNKTMEEHTPLTLACQMGQHHIVSALLETYEDDCNPSVRTLNGMTPLLCAANGGHTEICRLLIAHGADINQRGDGSYPLHNSIYHKHEDTALALLALGADPQICDREGWHPLYYAATNGFTSICKALVQRGCDLDFGRFIGGDGGGFHPLLSAIYQGHVEAANFLVASGANVTLFDRTGRDALCYAASGGHIDLLRHLLDNGAKPNLARKTDMLHENVHQPEAVRVFLSQGVPVDQLDGLGRTPLYIAAGFGCLETCHVLINHGASVNNIHSYCTGSMINSPLLKALHEGNRDIMELLLRSGADPNTGRNPLLHALSLKHYDICRMLLENRIISPNVTDADNNCPLHVATRNNFEAGCRLLLRHGANPNRVNAHGEQPLRMSIEAGLWTAVKWLLLAGSDLVGGTRVFLSRSVETTDQEMPLASTLRSDNEWHPARACATVQVKADDADEKREAAERRESWEWVRDACRRPMALIELTRMSIRRHLGDELTRKKEDPNWKAIPRIVKDYIYLENEDDESVTVEMRDMTLDRPHEPQKATVEHPPFCYDRISSMPSLT